MIILVPFLVHGMQPGQEIVFEFVLKNHLLLVVKIGGIVYVSHYFEDDRERIFILPYIG
jgi:hypothetical protein